jgi:hypothetical protein
MTTAGRATTTPSDGGGRRAAGGTTAIGAERPAGVGLAATTGRVGGGIGGTTFCERKGPVVEGWPRGGGEICTDARGGIGGTGGTACDRVGDAGGRAIGGATCEIGDREG